MYVEQKQQKSTHSADETDNEPETDRDKIRRLFLEKTTTQQQPSAKKPGRPKGSKNKRSLQPLDYDQMVLLKAERGSEYDQPARLVIEAASLSAHGVAIYWYLDNKLGRLPQCTVRVGLTEIAERFSIDEDKVALHIQELRDHSLVYKRSRGVHRYNEYELPLRKMRIDSQQAIPKK